MIRSRIFYYELKRAIFSKAYAFLILMVFAYSVYTIKHSVLRGFANTAPYSEWTFIKYLLSISPFLSAVLLFYISRLFSPNEKNAMHITSSMPNSGPMYFLIKLTVITLTYVIASVLSIMACFVFYGMVFEFFDFKLLLVCIVLILVPQMLFLQGIGIWAARLQYNLIYVLIVLGFFVNFIKLSLPYYLDIPGSSIMKIPEKAIPVDGYISFIVPDEFFVSRVILCIFGLLLLIGGCMKYGSFKIE